MASRSNPATIPPNLRFSLPVRSPWNPTPKPARSAIPDRAPSHDLHSGGRCQRAFVSVDFPHPFGPTMPVIELDILKPTPRMARNLRLAPVALRVMSSLRYWKPEASVRKSTHKSVTSMLECSSMTIPSDHTDRASLVTREEHQSRAECHNGDQTSSNKMNGFEDPHLAKHCRTTEFEVRRNGVRGATQGILLECALRHRTRT